MENLNEQELQESQIQPPNQTQQPFRPPVSNNTVNNKFIYELYLRKNYEKCLALMRSSQGNEFHIYVTGLIERDKLNLQRALELFKECHMMDKLNYEYLKEIARTMFLLGKFKSSLEAANEAVKIRRDWELDFLFGKVYVALGDSQKATEYLTKSLELEPNEESYIELTRLFILQRRYEKAYTLLKEAVRYSEENATLYEMLGFLAMKLDKVAQAAVDFTVCLETDPFDFNALLGLGSILQSKNEVDEAILKYKYAFTVSPNSSFLWNNTGMCFFEKQKLIAAYTCLTKSIYLDPFEWKSYANLGIVCLELEKPMSAFVNFNFAISLNPRDSELFMLLGVSLSQLRDFINAEKAYQESLNLVRDGHCYINYAIMLIRKRDYTRARSLLQEAFETNSVNPNLETISKMISLVDLKQRNEPRS